MTRPRPTTDTVKRSALIGLSAFIPALLTARLLGEDRAARELLAATPALSAMEFAPLGVFGYLPLLCGLIAAGFLIRNEKDDDMNAAGVLGVAAMLLVMLNLMVNGNLAREAVRLTQGGPVSATLVLSTPDLGKAALGSPALNPARAVCMNDYGALANLRGRLDPVRVSVTIENLGDADLVRVQRLRDLTRRALNRPYSPLNCRDVTLNFAERYTIEHAKGGSS